MKTTLHTRSTGENIASLQDNQAVGIIQPLYLNRAELGPFLGMSERKAREILAAYGLKPVDLGRGRGNGLRWRTSAVITIADTLHAEAQAQRNHAKRKARAEHKVCGRSAAELYAEFNRDTPVL
jgi:hypothetical protein